VVLQKNAPGRIWDLGVAYFAMLGGAREAWTRQPRSGFTPLEGGAAHSLKSGGPGQPLPIALPIKNSSDSRRS
jgi:hypothetical protein